MVRKKVATTTRVPTQAPPNPSGSQLVRRTRHIPAGVKRAVWRRDGARCAFVSKTGRRCDERAFVEFHHVDPEAVGGEPSVSNIELRCRAHNDYEAMLFYGRDVMRRATRSGKSRSLVGLADPQASPTSRSALPRRMASSAGSGRPRSMSQSRSRAQA